MMCISHMTIWRATGFGMKEEGGGGGQSVRLVPAFDPFAKGKRN